MIGFNHINQLNRNVMQFWRNWLARWRQLVLGIRVHNSK